MIYIKIINGLYYYSIGEFVEFTNWGRARVYTLCDRGYLDTIIVNTYRYISIKSLEACLEWIKEYSIINGFEDYTISPDGEIRKIKGRKAPLILKTSYDKDGYKECSLRNSRGKYYFRVHRLVALNYIPNPNNYPVVNHKNGIKDDNRVENLEWCTVAYNTQHSFDVLGRKGNITTNKHCILYKGDVIIKSFPSLIELENYLKDINFKGYSRLRRNFKYKDYTIKLVSNDYRKTTEYEKYDSNS